MKNAKIEICKALLFVIEILIFIVLVAIYHFVIYRAGFINGVKEQIKDNIKHGVMNQDGEWLPKYILAK